MIQMMEYRRMRRLLAALLFVGLIALLAACGDEPEGAGGDGAAAAQATASEEQALAEVEPTAAPTQTTAPTSTPTAQPESEEPPATEPAPPTSTPVPTSTVDLPTDTPEATETASPTPTETAMPAGTPTDTPAPQPTSPPAPAPTEPPAEQEPPPPTAVPPAEPTSAPEPVLGVNLLPNGSFEEGHYNQNGIPELQLPNGWRLEWDEGPTGFGGAKWDVYVRPEARVLSTAFLPPEEHGLYIYNGQHTVKIFKGSGAVSFRLLTDVTLEPGTYVIEAKMFADVVEQWSEGVKQWPANPDAADFRFIVGDGGTVWTRQNFGQINVHNWTFTVDQTKTIPVGIWLRGKYAIANNGWFIDDLSLRRVE